jgi:hypothetical protein
MQRDMKINPKLLSLACAAVVGALWIVKSVAVFALTVLAMNLSGEAGYLDFSNLDWKHALIQFTGNLFQGVGIAALAGWLIAAAYNFLSEISDPEQIKLK